MDDDERVRLAEQALFEGDAEAARRIVEIVLARSPHHPGARRLLAALPGTAAGAMGIPPEALGDLRPDARHLWAPLDAPDVAPARPATPVGIAILAGLTAIGGAMAILLGTAAIRAGPGIGVALALFGALGIGAGVGLWRLRPWAWYLAVITTALGVVFNVLGVISGEGARILLVLIQLVVLVYLLLVRSHFMGPPSLGSARRPRGA